MLTDFQTSSRQHCRQVGYRHCVSE